MDTGRINTAGYRAPSARPPTGHHYRAVGTANQRGSSETSSSQRLGTAIGFASGSMISDRPITQHGLSGLSTAQTRQGTATGMRQIKDKRYWQSQLQLKMTEISRETEKLVKESEAMNREKSAKRSFEKRVKESAKDLTGLQSNLSDMNIVLDAHSSGLTRQQLQQETLALRQQNEAIQSQLEVLFNKRQSHADQNQQLQAALQLERNKISEMVFALPPGDQQKYHRLQTSAEDLRNQINVSHEQVDSATRKLTRLQANVMTSQNRSEAARLLSKLNEFLNRRNALRDEDSQRLTPAQEREKLIAEVRQNNATLVSINNQLKLVDAQLVDKRDQLAQTNQDLEEGQSDRHTKYLELKRRDQTMSAFMDTFAENMAREKEAIELLKNQITYGIEQITLQGVNLKSYGLAKSTVIDEKNDLGSLDGLQREYKRLSIQLKQLQILEKRTRDQLTELQSDEQQFELDVKKFNNHQIIRDEATLKMDSLNASIEELKKKKNTTEGVISDARKRNTAIKAQLTGNERYRQISHIEEKLSDLIKDNRSLQDQLDQTKRQYDYSELQNKVTQQLNVLMEILRNDTK